MNLIEFDHCTNAAKYGNLERLEYFYQNGFPCDEKTFAIAAKYGHKNCLKYLYLNRCPWDEMTTAMAASGGHLECFEYLVKKECPWNKEKCLKIAVKKNITSIINFIENEMQDEMQDEEIPVDSMIHLNCEICLSNKKCVAYNPCGHVSCWSCYKKLEKEKKCHVCRGEISSFLKIYL
jgi:hypothetical protein